MEDHRPKAAAVRTASSSSKLAAGAAATLAMLSAAPGARAEAYFCNSMLRVHSCWMNWRATGVEYTRTFQNRNPRPRNMRVELNTGALRGRSYALFLMRQPQPFTLGFNEQRSVVFLHTATTSGSLYRPDAMTTARQIGFSCQYPDDPPGGSPFTDGNAQN